MELSIDIFVSLDGVMQGPGGAAEDTSSGFKRGGWLVPFADQYWSAVTDPQNRVATALNTLPKFVVSKSMTDAAPDWRESTTVLSGDVIDEIRKLKQHPGRELQRDATR